MRCYMYKILVLADTSTYIILDYNSNHRFDFYVEAIAT